MTKSNDLRNLKHINRSWQQCLGVFVNFPLAGVNLEALEGVLSLKTLQTAAGAKQDISHTSLVFFCSLNTHLSSINKVAHKQMIEL